MRVLIIFFYLVLGLFLIATLVYLTETNLPNQALFEGNTKSYIVS